MSDVIVAGDIGGTKTNIGLFEVAAGQPRLLRSASFHSAEYPGLSPIVTSFLGEETNPVVKAACFGIAGPVLDNRVTAPNLAWQIDGAQMAGEVNVPQVLLINDLVATAEGIPLLAADETVLLQAGVPEPPGHEGNRVLLAAGTGLGMALLPRIGGAPGTWVPVPSEGGHADFAPRNEEEIGLLRSLRERFARVSVERVLSGPGLFNVYRFLRDILHAPESAEVREALARGDDPARVIGEHGLGAPAVCPLCSKALEMFAAIYGAVAGNLALTGTATNGVWLGGGIAPKILPRLSDGLFLQSFLAKGRLAPYLERVPVRVILNQRAAMLGAARRAAALV
ncbi:MAG TPA: glucokinase [Thermoanaerobaculia bacterium]|jgi:glucokinase|nr:glucokinase [Thermoanaerobaculia bacterium]